VGGLVRLEACLRDLHLGARSPMICPWVSLQGERVFLTNIRSRYNEDSPSPSPCEKSLNIMETKVKNSNSASRKVNLTVGYDSIGRISSQKFFKRTENKRRIKIARGP
jgi:hypothetical protein